MKTIVLSNGEEAIVDDDDFDFVNKWKWKKHCQGYACRTSYRNKKSILVLMHREIDKTPAGLEIDHKNENKLDNRKDNFKRRTPTDHRIHHSDKIVAFQKNSQIYPDIKICAVCGNEFKVNPRKRKRNKCCSPKCAMQMRIEGRLIQCGKLPSSRK